MIDYAIVGGGRLARHFSHYFQLLKIPHTAWVRDRWLEFNTHATGDNDHQTIERTLQALEHDPLHDVYQAFIDFHQAGNHAAGKVEGNRTEAVK